MYISVHWVTDYTRMPFSILVFLSKVSESGSQEQAVLPYSRLNTDCPPYPLKRSNRLTFSPANQSSYGPSSQQLGSGYSGGYSSQSSVGGFREYSECRPGSARLGAGLGWAAGGDPQASWHANT